MDIILGKERKRWSEDRKREIVAETVAAGEVAGVARRHGANPSMVFGWRKRLLEEQRPPAPPAFVPVALAMAERPAHVAPDTIRGAAAETPTIDLAFACGARLRVRGAVDADLVAGIVKALRRA
ncbi:MAG: IS66-like element accessory protein TnpA [Vitreimonas sp.]